MNSKRTFSVYTIGLADSEMKVLRNIFKLSLYRTRSYALLDSAIEGSPEILIVDLATANARSLWDQRRARNPNLPAVLVAPPPSDAHPYHVRRPFVASRVLGMLDQVVINEHGFAPEAVNGENARESASTADIGQAAAPEAIEKPVKNGRHKALVVDDSMPVRKQLEIELDLLGVTADFAESGERAFELLDRGVYDIIFLDVVLPGVDGYRICKTIKKDSTKKGMPVVMLTSKSSPFDRVRGTFAGCDTYLTKPVAQESFEKVVRKYLG